MSRGRGVRPSDPEKLAGRADVSTHPRAGGILAAHLAGALVLPGAVDLASFEPPRADQGPTPTCFAHAPAWATATAFAAAGRTLWVPSPKLIAAGCTAIERALSTPAGAAPGKLDDQGGQLADVVTFLAKYGAEPMKGPTADGRNSDVDPATMNDEINLADLEAAGQRIIAGAYGITPATSSTSDKIAAALVAGLPVVLAFDCDSAFEALQAGQVAPAPDEKDPTAGGHAVYLSGYQTAADGSRLFKLSNSWSSTWCDGGRCLVGPAWLEQVWELWPWDVVRGSVGK